MSAILNITTNRTQPLSCLSSGNLKAERIRTTLAYCLIAAFSLAGNSFICIIFYRTKAMRKPINFLIVNMAVSDLLHPIFTIPWFVIEMYTDSWNLSHPLGLIFCKLGYFLPNVSIGVSVQSLVLIAVDRFGAVVFPLRYPIFNPKLCFLLILTATWIVALIMFCPNIIAFKLVEYPGKLICELQWEQIFGKNSDNRDYLVTLLTFWYFIPFSLIAILYSIILLKLKSQKVLGESSFNARKQRLEQQKRVLRMAIAIVFGFAICWIPFCTFYLLVSFFWESINEIQCGVIKLFWFIALILAQANTVLNPCICFIFSENYRQGLMKILKHLGTFKGEKISCFSSFCLLSEKRNPMSSTISLRRAMSNLYSLKVAGRRAI